MDSKTIRCCGNCLHFHNEDAEGKGWCYAKNKEKYCSEGCKQHEFKNKSND